MSISCEVHKSELSQNIVLKLCTHVHGHFSAHLSQKIVILKLLSELNLHWVAHINVLSFRGIFMQCMGKKVNARKNCDTDKKNMLMHLLVSTKEFISREVVHQSVVICYSCITNVLDFDEDRGRV